MSISSDGGSARGTKARDAFRTISEVADMLGVAQHVLRFWESKFTQVKPLKRGGNRRYYRPADVRLLQAVQALLHGEGYTIRGVQKLFKEQGLKATIAQALGEQGAVPSAGSDRSVSDTAPDVGALAAEQVPHNDSHKGRESGAPAGLDFKGGAPVLEGPRPENISPKDNRGLGQSAPDKPAALKGLLEELKQLRAQMDPD